MKRFFVVFSLLAAGMNCVFAWQSHISLDYSYQFYTKNAEYEPDFISEYEFNDTVFDGQKQRRSSIISVSYEGYFNDDDIVGLFVNIGLVIPHNTTIKFNNETIKNNGFGLGCNVGIGPSFRIPVSSVDFVISPFVSVGYGGNLGGVYSLSRDKSFSESYWEGGVGLDLRARFNITEHFYMALGAAGRVNLLDLAASATISDAWLDESMGMSFSIAPVFSVGFRFHEPSIF